MRSVCSFLSAPLAAEGAEAAARQGKFWVQCAPDGERWEIYTVLADSQTFYDEDPDAPECCATDASAQAEPAASAGRCC